jgi:hypothetical protein
MRIIATVLLTLALAVAMSSLASAQTLQGYAGPEGTIQSQIEGTGDGSGTAATTTDTGGSLPFTGLDLALLAMAGGVLVVVGVGMRRLTRAPESV